METDEADRVDSAEKGSFEGAFCTFFLYRFVIVKAIEFSSSTTKKWSFKMMSCVWLSAAKILFKFAALRMTATNESSGNLVDCA